MNRNDFIKEYTAIIQRTLLLCSIARREGLLALEETLDKEKINSRDILEYGIRFVIDGTDKLIIDKILSNIIEQEKDELKKILKIIQKEAVSSIQEGLNPRLLLPLLNSYTDIPLTSEELDNYLEKIY